MEWNLESSARIKLLDNEIVAIVVDCNPKISCHCEDCYSSRVLTQTLLVKFKDGEVICKITGTSKYILDEGNVIRFFANNKEKFAKMSRYEVRELIKRLEERKISDDEIWEIYRSLI